MAEEKRPVQLIHRVLVVEDDHELADLLSEVLTYENCTADLASNGMEAMEKLRGYDYDAVVCDLMLPRIDGEALYQQVAQQYPYLSDRFLFITGHATHRGGHTDFIYRSGNSLLEKPFEIEQLRAALKELFRH
jgi:two-component system cell cycle sensor histidine kinase/response regulator CckA